MGKELTEQWYVAVLEEYRSLRAEAVASRDAQLSVLRLTLPLIAALIGLGITQKQDDPLLGGVLLSITPIVTVLTFELWLGEVQRTIRAGAVVAAIEQRLGELFSNEEVDGKRLGPPLGWELWLRRPATGRDGAPVVYPQIESTFTGAAVFFAFLLFLAAGSVALGTSFLFSSGEDAVALVIASCGVIIAFYLPIRAATAVRRLRDSKLVYLPSEIWPDSAERPKPGSQ